MTLAAAERLIRHFAIDKPQDIDLPAIAWAVGCRVKERPLDGCEARIIGHGDRAVITVNSRSSPRRRRFSIAHELGHWEYHRGRLLVCRSDEIGGGSQRKPVTERLADAYAAELLMPGFLFDPMARATRKFDFQNIRRIAEEFDCSVTATAIRLIERRHCTGILVCHSSEGRDWFVRSPLVPERWFPQRTLDSDSFAHDILFKGHADDVSPHRMEADTWFDRDGADRFELLEQTIRTGEDEILTLLTIDDDEMLDDQETRFSGR